MPPSLAELEHRLIGRGQDSAEVIAERMSKAMNEISHYDEYDYMIINDNFEQALSDLQGILRAEKLTLTYQQRENKALINELLAKSTGIINNPFKKICIIWSKKYGSCNSTRSC